MSSRRHHRAPLSAEELRAQLRHPSRRRRPEAGGVPAGRAAWGTRAASGRGPSAAPGPRRPPVAPRSSLLPPPAERARRRQERRLWAESAPVPVDTLTPRRVRALFLVAAGLVALLVLRVVDVQVLRSSELAERGRRQLIRTDRLPAQRGSIFDRKGRELVISVDVPTIAADPSLVADPAAAAVALEPLLNVDAGDLAERLGRRGTRFVYLARRVDHALAERVRALGLPGVFTITEPKRVRPAAGLGVPVLGRVGIDNEGLSGVERQYDDVLKGRPGKLVSERDQQGREIPGGRIEHDPSARGDDLVLTIDRSLQFETERLLAAQIEATGAKGGMALVMETGTGELLAVANLTVDPETGAAGPADRNMAVTNVYEPGSVAKVVTIAGAVEDGAVAADEVMSVPGHIKVGDHVYTEHEPHPTVDWSVTDIVANSSNVGTIQVARRLGKERFDAYLRSFGFGQLTALRSPGEAPGILLDPAKYSGTSMGSFPIGQGFAVTSMQTLAAYNTVANGGVYVPPRIVRATVGPDGVQRPAPPPEQRRVISAQTAADLGFMLSEVVRVGTGTLAAIDGYGVAGKTGTARKPKIGARGYQEGAYVSSFAGFVPAEDPKLTILVVLDEPTPIYGGLVAAPVFAGIGRYALREMRVPPPAGPRPATSARPATEQTARGVGDPGDAAATSTTGRRAGTAPSTTAPGGTRTPGRSAPTTTVSRPCASAPSSRPSRASGTSAPACTSGRGST